MKLLQKLLTNIFCTFSVLAVLIGVLCAAGILEKLPYDEIVFPVLYMSCGTALFVTLRENFLCDAGKWKYVLDICGCCAIIFLTGYLTGWFVFEIFYLALIFGMVIAVYLAVWLLTWLQCKRDEGDLNRLLAHRDKNSDCKNS